MSGNVNYPKAQNSRFWNSVDRMSPAQRATLARAYPRLEAELVPTHNEILAQEFNNDPTSPMHLPVTQGAFADWLSGRASLNGKV